ncbi:TRANSCRIPTION FACTOR BHLH35 [Salix koriyanagi]|uniref:TRANSCRIPTION FACTOR BHLH35 n=1 Tax=Salix koriyanagi TaxID=2511006 RepID=A0A9Q0ZUA5_9ROSI|nr:TRANSCRIPTION FACTOR BHLH35 [Salix koriyanagi]
MDRASIIKDAINYIQELQEQERGIQAEILELESGRSTGFDVFEQDLPVLLRSKKKKIDDRCCDFGRSRNISRIEELELSVTSMREKTFVVSLTCRKRTDTMVKLCEVFESLRLKIITANVTTVSERVLKTVFIEADEDKDHLKTRIETAIAALNDPLIQKVRSNHLYIAALNNLYTPARIHELDDLHYSEFETIDYNMKDSSPQLQEDDEHDSRFYNDSEGNVDKICFQSSADRETCVDKLKMRQDRDSIATSLGSAVSVC